MESARIQLLDEPISPELCLVDPDLAERARRLAPFRASPPRVVPTAPTPPASTPPAPTPPAPTPPAPTPPAPARPAVRVVQLEPARLVPIATTAAVDPPRARRLVSARSVARYWRLVLLLAAVGAVIAVALGLLSNQSPRKAAPPAVRIPDQAQTTIPTHSSVPPSSARSSVPKAALEPSHSAAPFVITTGHKKSATVHSAAGSATAPTRSHPLGGAVKAAQTPPVKRGVVSGVAPVTLRWPAVKGALLYDVILWRGATRVLDLWPTTTHVVVPTSWKSGGKVFHRTRGMHFLWFVYPAVGSKTSPTYGSLIRSGAF
jgi:hypothetical protein